MNSCSFARVKEHMSGGGRNKIKSIQHHIASPLCRGELIRNEQSPQNSSVQEKSQEFQALTSGSCSYLHVLQMGFFGSGVLFSLR